MTLRRVFKTLVAIPNLPFIIALSIYILVNIYKHTGWDQMELMNPEESMNDEIKNHIDDIYPEYVRYSMAAIFYGWVLLTVL